MSKTLRLAHVRRAGIVLASGLACAAAPALAHASAINLGTASPFAVLGGSAVTNTGPSVIDGDLGVAPGTSLTGFGAPNATVNGATHDDDAVATQAQIDLTTAYNAAAASLTPTDLTGQDLGGMTLTPGAYSFSTSAQLTGALTLNAGGDANAQFVIEIGSTLTTATASSVLLVNGASPCNVYWQVGSSATLGSSTAFEGNVMAHTSISLNDSSTVQGRLLASGGAITLQNNVIDNSMCANSTSPVSTPPSTPITAPISTTTTTPFGTPAGSTTSGGNTQPGRPSRSSSTSRTRAGTAKLTRSALHSATACNYGFTATVRGREIERVVFTLDGKWLATRSGPRFSVHVTPAFAGPGYLKARVTFHDATRIRTLSLRYRACSAAAVRPLPGPSSFTG